MGNSLAGNCFWCIFGYISCQFVSSAFDNFSSFSRGELIKIVYERNHHHKKKNEKPNLFALKQQSNNIFVGNKFTNIKFFFFLCFRLLLLSFVFCIRIKRFFMGFSRFQLRSTLWGVSQRSCRLSLLCYAPVAAVSLSLSLPLRCGRRSIFVHLSLSLSLSPTRALQHCMRSFGCESLFARPIAAIWIVVRDIVLSITI